MGELFKKSQRLNPLGAGGPLMHQWSMGYFDSTASKTPPAYRSIHGGKGGFANEQQRADFLKREGAKGKGAKARTALSSTYS